jgi:uncharacterized membrane protein (UPF0127 family)
MASFVSALTKDDPGRYQLLNERTGTMLASSLLTAFDSASRRTGLLKYQSMPDRCALIIAPCNSIHMFFMKFPIDVAFVSRDGRILKIADSIRPWRVSISPRAFAAIELAAGELARHHAAVGDRLVVRARPMPDNTSS